MFWFALALAQTVEPPLIVRLEQAGRAYTTDGEEISLPAGAEIDVCDSPIGLVEYVLDSQVAKLHVLCAPRPLFRDGFE